MSHNHDETTVEWQATVIDMRDNEIADLKADLKILSSEGAEAEKSIQKMLEHMTTLRSEGAIMREALTKIKDSKLTPTKHWVWSIDLAMQGLATVSTRQKCIHAKSFASGVCPTCNGVA